MRRLLAFMLVATVVMVIPAAGAVADSQGSAARGLPEVTVIEDDLFDDGTVERRETISYRYNDVGSVTELFREFDDFPADGSIDEVEFVFFGYDSRGLLVESVGESSVTGRTTTVYSYNSRGLLTGLEVSSDGGCDPEQVAIYRYNRRGLLIEEAIDFIGFPPTCDLLVLELDLYYTYDRRGNPSTIVETWRSPLFALNRVFTSTLSYDNRGNLVEKVAEFDDGGDGVVEWVDTFTYSYDGFGNVTEEFGERDFFPPDGNPELVRRTTYTYTY